MLTVPVANADPGMVAVLVHPDGTREVIRKSITKNGDMRIPLEGSAQIETIQNGKMFHDVPAGSWSADAVAFVSSHELFNGTGEAVFSPNEPMTRGMLAVVLHNLESNPELAFSGAFQDVDESAWYAKGIYWAAAQGIVNGYGDGTFGAKDPITREQMAVMLWRYAGEPEVSGSDLNFVDADAISSYALLAMRWAVENGIINGKGGGVLEPKGPATRAQVAQMLINYLTR